MNRRQRIAIISPLPAALVAAALFGFGGAGSSVAGCGDEQTVGTAGVRSIVAEGRGTAAVLGNKLVMLDGGGNRSVYTPPSAGEGVLRHVVSALGGGTAYVSDHQGPDTLISIRPDGVSEIRTSGEAAHPTVSSTGSLVWAEDFKVLRLAPFDGGSITSIPRPRESSAVFMPLFINPNALLAVVQERVDGDRGEDDSLNNLYRYDLKSATWQRLTAFEGTFEDWSVLRTPVLAPDGTVFFVRLRGTASQTVPPSFELWALRTDDSVSKVRDLPKEMYLAGVGTDGLLWNISDNTEWRLFEETSTGLKDLGCGAVMVDPRSRPDPDVPMEDPALNRRSSFERRAAAGETPSSVDAEMAILVGDFSSRQGAEAVAGNLRVPGLQIVNHDLAPFAIAPGKWGVAKRLGADVDLALAVAEFQRSFPRYADRAWIVSLSGGSS